MKTRSVVLSGALATGLFLTSVHSANGTQRRRMPDSPTGRMAGALVELMGSGDENAVDAFMEERVVPDVIKDLEPVLKRLHSDLSGAELERAERTGPASARLSISSETDSASLSFALEKDPPHRLVELQLEIDDPSEANADAVRNRRRITKDATADSGKTPKERTDHLLQELTEAGLFSGSVVVAREGVIVYEGFFGLANRAENVPIGVDTKFDIGSITKTMTKAAVGQLARDGKLALEDTIAKHLPRYPNPSIAKRVTIRQLLEHRSGLGDIFTASYEQMDKSLLLNSRDFFPLFADEPLAFEPGQGQQYSNAGYIVLGAIIEAASGKDYVDYVSERIFEPAEMVDSGFFLRDGSRTDLAIGYTKGQGEARRETLSSNLGQLPIRGCSAGSSSHTARDLWRFERALRSGALLGPKWTEWFFGGKKASVGFGGGGPGVNAMLESDEKRTIVVLANLDPPSAQDVARNLEQIWSAAATTTPP